jgi:hypothetical protein
VGSSSSHHQVSRSFRVRGCSSTIQQVHLEQSPSSRDRLTTSELHPSRSPPRLFPRLLHTDPPSSLGLSPPIGVHPPRTAAASSSGYPPIRRPTVSAVTYRSRVAILREAPPSVFLAYHLQDLADVLARRQPRSLSGSSLLVPKRPQRSSRPRALSVPSRAPRFPIHPTPLRHSRFATRDLGAAHIFRWSLGTCFLDAHDPQVTLGMDTQHQHHRRFLARSLHRSLASRSLFLPALFDHQISCAPHHVVGGSPPFVRRQPAIASACLALRRCPPIRTTHTPCPPSIEHSELAG